MIEEYLYEMITLVVILTSLLLYFLLITQFKQENKKVLETIHLSESYELSGEEEGSFDTTSPPFEKEGTTVHTSPRKKKIKKVKVPAHGKIHKENFKDFSGIKILVAEDNIINQEVIRGLLADSGIQITMADNGQVALDILEKNADFDIILMDVHMPIVDGFQATRRIRADSKYEHIIVVALSGDTAADDITKMKTSGMEEYLEKPLRMDAFYDILYAYTKEESQLSEFVEVIMTKELNGDQGLHVCGGDDEFYKDILHEFIQSYTNSPQKLSDLLDRNKTYLADSMLLDFIGITANIGALNISKIALELKKAIKDTEEKSYSIILEEYKLHLEILVRDIKEYIQ
ncbi:MAG: hypothetical protein COB42_07920 [Sulfurimonas sp.]|nr:MAG: hypothetical protein COB42_07920 [Sulfurimonas sp.]